jgi:opacity protein-like surface antigen
MDHHHARSMWETRRVVCMKRQVIAGLLTIGLGLSAHAQDARVYAPSDLVPGTPVYWNWSGFYVGGQWGSTSGTFNPNNATGSMVAHILRDTTIEQEKNISSLPQLSNVSSHGQSYGGFVGFNQQWEDIILGLEASYNAGKLSGTATDLVGRSYTASDGYLYNVILNSRASATLKDYGTLRARAGYAMGRFMPFVQVGGAVGRADMSRSVTVALAGTDADPANAPALPDVALNDSMSESKKNGFIYGFTAGGGLEVAITENIFLRGEYEYLHFFPFKGMTFDVHSARIGAALKF